MAKRTKFFHARISNPISFANKIIAQKDNIHANQAMILNAPLYSKETTLHDTMNTAVTVRNNSEVAAFNIAGYRRTITLLTEGVSKVNHFFRNKIIRDEKINIRCIIYQRSILFQIQIKMIIVSIV